MCLINVFQSAAVVDVSSDDEFEDNQYVIDADEDMMFENEVTMSKKQEPLSMALAYRLF